MADFDDKVPAEQLPTTYEEWVEIHGEPEYLFEKRPHSALDITVTDCEEQDTPRQIDTSGIVWEDKRERRHINYAKFLDVFRELNNIVCCNGAFYTPNGRVSGDSVLSDIHFSLKDTGWTDNLDKPAKSLYNSLKSECHVDRLPVDQDVIPLQNGDLHIGKGAWEFRWREKKHAPYRLSVRYTPQEKPMPLFNKWLRDLFDPEDILTVQEIFGYCLVPVTAAQEAFFLVGEGETGKSGIGHILKGLLGNAFEEINTQDLVTKRFQVATVENKLVAYDDDLGSAALTETGLLKKLITADTAIPAERKNEQPYTFMSYCRIVAGANFMLSSLYDDSNGFFRRLHPILVKPKDPARRDIAHFYDMILEQEKEQILRWALAGLKRVMENGWQVHWSARSRDYMGVVKSAGTHFGEFFDDVLTVGPEGAASMAEIKKLYARWCKDNAVQPASDRRLERWFSENAEKKGYKADKNVLRGGKKLRGYKNLKVKTEWEPVINGGVRF